MILIIHTIQTLHSLPVLISIPIITTIITLSLLINHHLQIIVNMEQSYSFLYLQFKSQVTIGLRKFHLKYNRLRQIFQSSINFLIRTTKYIQIIKVIEALLYLKLHGNQWEIWHPKHKISYINFQLTSIRFSSKYGMIKKSWWLKRKKLTVLQSLLLINRKKINKWLA